MPWVKMSRTRVRLTRSGSPAFGGGAAGAPAAGVELVEERAPLAGLRALVARGDFAAVLARGDFAAVLARGDLAAALARGDFAAVEPALVRAAGLRAAVDLRDPPPAGFAARGAPEPLPLVERGFSSGIFVSPRAVGQRQAIRRRGRLIHRCPTSHSSSAFCTWRRFSA
jgi:hypothetical protein